jgi:hypothetical protein
MIVVAAFAALRCVSASAMEKEPSFFEALGLDVLTQENIALKSLDLILDSQEDMTFETIEKIRFFASHLQTLDKGRALILLPKLYRWANSLVVCYDSALSGLITGKLKVAPSVAKSQLHEISKDLRKVVDLMDSIEDKAQMDRGLRTASYMKIYNTPHDAWTK